MADNLDVEMQDVPVLNEETSFKPCLWKDCTASFQTREALVAHLSTVHYPKGTKKKPSMKQGEWKCLWNKCEQKAYAIRATLVSHVLKHNFGFALPTCTLCRPSQTFNSQLDLDSHNVDLHTRLPPAKLPIGDGEELPPLPSLPPLPPLQSLPSSSSSPQVPQHLSNSNTYTDNPLLSVYETDVSHLQPRYYPNSFPCNWNDNRHVPSASTAKAKCQYLITSDVEGFTHVVQHIRRRAEGHHNWNCFWSVCASSFGKRQLLVEHLALKHFKVAHCKCPRQGCDEAFSKYNLLVKHLERSRCNGQRNDTQGVKVQENVQDQAGAHASGSESPARIKGKNRWPKKVALKSSYPDPAPLEDTPLPPSQIPVPPITSYYTRR
ncbi:hypothetical protein JCM5350_003933 [Sporobolomyces pararoseus]